MQGHRLERDLVAFAERVLALLDQGSFVATYKYAVLPTGTGKAKASPYGSFSRSAPGR